MKYVLDTNVCIHLLNGTSGNILEKIPEIPNNDIIIPAIVRFELYYGACKSMKNQKTLEIVSEFLDTFATIEFDNEIAKIAGRIRSDLDKIGKPIGPYDLLIAASALLKDYTLVSHNIKEFSRVENLKIVDWEAEK